MSRLLAMTCCEYITPMTPLKGLNVMKEGYDGSGVGILLRDLGGPFADMKDSPILSGIFSKEGIKRLDKFMLELGFMTKYKVTFKLPETRPDGVPERGSYLIRAYDTPDAWNELSEDARKTEMMNIRLRIRKMGEAGNDMIVFSFWPDTIMLKEVGDPEAIAQYLDLDRQDLSAKIIMVQGWQNTNYEIDLYACHPFFLQGYSTMANGENTAFTPNRDYLVSNGFAGYSGYKSDSEVFTHALHFTMEKLGLGMDAFKHVITPLHDAHLNKHPQANLLRHIKHSCRQLIIDGPNCIIGCLPDKSLFMAQDSKKLRPGVAGGKPGCYVFSSELCGLDAVLPDREKIQDFQPMHMDTVVIGPERDGLRIYRQTDTIAN